jgi:hypothetical protein
LVEALSHRTEQGGEVSDGVLWPESVVRHPTKYQTKFKRVDAMLYDGRNIQDIWDWVGAGLVYGPTEEDENAYVFIRGAKEILEPGFWLVREEDEGGLRPCDPFNFYQLLESYTDAETRANSATGKWLSEKIWGLDPDAQMLVLNLVIKLLALEDEINRD